MDADCDSTGWVKQRIADVLNDENTSLYIEISVKVKSDTVSQAETGEP